MSNNMSEHHRQDVVFDEWSFKIWTDNSDWCRHCKKEKNKLIFDEQTRTTCCSQCGHVETYVDEVWRVMQAQRYVSYNYMPGKYLFGNLSKEEIFQKYLREQIHIDWSSWLLHDYMLAKLKQDKPTQDKLSDTAKLVVEKMSYDIKPWNSLFEKMNKPQDFELFYQIPQIIYEFVEKKLLEVTQKEKLPLIMRDYAATLNSIYNYSRWKNDRVTCWIISEIIKLCDLESHTMKTYTNCFNCDPILENFTDDIITGKKRDFDLNETYIQWELNLADSHLADSHAYVAVWSAYSALTAKLGIHAIWPPTKVLPFDVNTVKKVCELVNDPELFRFYDLATDLNSIDPPKACYYAKYFIKNVKELLPKITPPHKQQEQTNPTATTYIT
ncbi:MAG: hypothetical protein LBC03_00010 [Nitrososphaerota archaeon]|jgi:hypothetical protein|nr:hypothetical protein [Nitrososphaerota archaeon]